MALSSRRMNQIFQTMTLRLDEGKKGPPDTYSDEEKDYYSSVEKEYLESEKNGTLVDFDVPNDYDWD